jgi:hypothetical protein
MSKQAEAKRLIEQALNAAMFKAYHTGRMDLLVEVAARVKKIRPTLD